MTGALQNTVPPPFGDRIARPRRAGYKAGEDPHEGLLAESWENYMGHQSVLTEKFPGRVANAEVLREDSSLGPTDMTDGTLSAGVYRLNYYLAVNQAASVGPLTIDLTITWQDSVTRTFTDFIADASSGAAYESGVFPIYLDALSPVQYTTVNNGDGTYDLRLILEEVMA